LFLSGLSLRRALGLSGADPGPAPAPLAAVLGPDAHHQGDLSFEGRVRVDGHFSGRLYGEDTLELGVHGLIEGEVDVADAIIAGTVRGRLRVRRSLRIEPTADIEGLIDCGAVEVLPGARLKVELRAHGVSEA
jgi:cytoskeletal protein CcmA (bactofilin family)